MCVEANTQLKASEQCVSYSLKRVSENGIVPMTEPLVYSTVPQHKQSAVGCLERGMSNEAQLHERSSGCYSSRRH